MAKIKIVVDNASDIPQEYVEKYDIGMLYILSVFGEESYAVGKDITLDEFYEKLKNTSKIPTTAQTPYMDMYEYLFEQSKNYDTIIYFTLSSKGSGQYHTATMVVDEIKEENPNVDIRIVDSMAYSLYMADAAIHACKMIEQGAGADEIVTVCSERMKKTQASFMVDDLKYLQKGGRVSKAVALFGTILEIKPILCVQDGVIDMATKIRGKKKLLDKIIENMENDPAYDASAGEFMIVHTDEERALQLKEKLEESYGEGSVKMVARIGSVIATHVGFGTVAVFYRTK